MSNRTDTVLDTFANVYRLCRVNRNSVHFAGQFFRFDGGSIYIAAGGVLVVKREGSTIGAAFYAACLLANGRFSYADSRRHWIDRCRDTDPVRLP